MKNSLHKLAAFYFFAYGGSGGFFPLIPLVLSARGLTGTEISWVMALNPALNLIVPPLWSLFADAFHARVAMLRAVAFGSAFTVLLFVPPWGLAGAALAMIAFCIFRTPTASLMDAATYGAIGADRGRYARIRMWGSVGFGGCVAIAGAIDAARNSTVVIVLVAALFFSAGLVSLSLSSPPIVREERVFGRAIEHIVRSRMVLLFFTNACYYGAHSTFDTYFSLHVEHLGLPAAVAGTGWAVAVFCEVGLMAVARPILASRSSWSLLLFASAVSTARWLAISVVADPTLLVLLQVAHGVTFGLWYLALVHHVQERVPEELRTSVQGVLLASLSFGTIGGVLAGGALLDRFGGGAMFQGAALFSLLAFALYYRLSRRPACAHLAPSGILPG